MSSNNFQWLQVCFVHGYTSSYHGAGDFIDHLSSNLTRPHKMAANSTPLLLTSSLTTSLVMPFLGFLQIPSPVQITRMFVIVIGPVVGALVHFFGAFARCQLKQTRDKYAWN
jgi:hypothetical protein